MIQDVKVLDGGFSTQLNQNIGHDFNKDPLWTTSFLKKNPDAVRQTHLDFLRAGADIIETNTYQAYIDGFKRYLNLTDEEAYDLIRKAAEIAKEAVKLYKKENPKADPTIFGSIGPYGATLHDGSEYNGSYTDKISTETMINWHRPRFEALMEAGVDHFAIETIPSEKEALALAEFIKNYPNIKAWISFSCKDDQHIAHGENFQETALKVYNSNPKQIIAIGANCLNPNYVSNLFRGINSGDKSIALVVYPNNGDVYRDGEWHVTGDAPPLTKCIEEWFDLGVRFFGGCCRTYAVHIKEIRDKLKELGRIY